jgi:hypothetical protein
LSRLLCSNRMGSSPVTGSDLNRRYRIIKMIISEREGSVDAEKLDHGQPQGLQSRLLTRSDVISLNFNMLVPE